MILPHDTVREATGGTIAWLRRLVILKIRPPASRYPVTRPERASVTPPRGVGRDPARRRRV